MKGRYLFIGGRKVYVSRGMTIFIIWLALMLLLGMIAYDIHLFMINQRLND